MATRSDIGVAPKSLAAILRLPLPLDIWSGLASATTGSDASSDFGSISHADTVNDAAISVNKDALLRPLLVNFLLLGIPIFIKIPVTMVHSHPLRGHVSRPFLMHLLGDGPVGFR